MAIIITAPLLNSEMPDVRMYRTIKEAAEALGVTPPHVVMNIRGPQPKKRGRWEGWTFTRDDRFTIRARERPDKGERERGRPGHPVVVRDDEGTSVKFRSQAAACEVLGVPPARMSAYCKLGRAVQKGEFEGWLFTAHPEEAGMCDGIPLAGIVLEEASHGSA